MARDFRIGGQCIACAIIRDNPPAIRQLGVGAVDLSFVGKTVEATLAEMRRFREEVASRL